ncbi:MAG: ABC transporter permease [Chlorobi bacterium]|nr:ABC transporter permease [Chlorobiota bacterium]
MNNVKIAWRNLWRNKKRTFITVASIFFGVFLSTFMTSMQQGSYSGMIDNIVKFYSGYIQIQNEDYWENKTINNSFQLTDSLISTIKSVTEITQITPRLESFALISTENLSQGAVVVGIEPENENNLTGLSKWVKEGNYLSSNDDGILMGKLLAKYLKANINDTIVLLSQGYHGSGAAGKFVLRGILDFPSPELSKGFVYMELKNCQQFYSAEGFLTSLVLMVKDQSHLPKAKRKLSKIINSPYRIMTWDEMSPEMVNMIESDKAGGVIMKIILYMIISFGIFGTILMMLNERKREFGVMIAIGMQKTKLGKILFYETLMIGLLGVVLGFLVSIPTIAYYFAHPIVLTGDAAKTMIDIGVEPLMKFSWKAMVFYNQVIIVFVITFLIAFLPLTNINKLNVVKALKG